MREREAEQTKIKCRPHRETGPDPNHTAQDQFRKRPDTTRARDAVEKQDGFRAFAQHRDSGDNRECVEWLRSGGDRMAVANAAGMKRTPKRRRVQSKRDDHESFGAAQLQAPRETRRRASARR